ncbi:hypothetical protein HMPREF1155_0949 [Slackia sp. CM382]|nr:hypothetical protein HMPREF1155_0949 [Slackia sp. CM382]
MGIPHAGMDLRGMAVSSIADGIMVCGVCFPCVSHAFLVR